MCSIDEQFDVGDAPGSVILPAGITGLSKDSVANVSLIVALDKQQLTERARKILRRQIDLIIEGIDVILGRSRLIHSPRRSDGRA